MSGTLEGRVCAIAEGQYGVVTREQLVSAGMSRGGLRHRLAVGRLRRLHRGVYLVGPLLVPRARQLAAVLACGQHAVLSHHDASELWLPEQSAPPPSRGERSPFGGRRSPAGGGRAPADAARTPAGAARTPAGAGRTPAGGRSVHVTVAHTGRSHKSGIRLHRVHTLGPGDRTVVDGIPVTTPARTVLDLAPVLELPRLERLTARMAREGLLDLDELASRVAASPGRGGVQSLRSVLTRAGGPALTRSEAEAVFLALIRKAGLPAPEVNVSIGRYELDFYWSDARLAVEIDGFRHHSTRPRFEGDRRKDAWLRARGVTVIRLSWRQITREEMVTAVQLGQALMHALR